VRRVLLALGLMLLCMAAWARPIDFRDDTEQLRFRALTEQLRCVMCQNQSLADSSAPIAHDLRLEVLRMMREGKTDAEIKQFLVARYTDFVLYQPEVKPMTWLLWFGPGVLLLAGATVVFVIVRKNSGDAPSAPPADDKQEW
jgi:cytochrome c-type biogenesis protein CcmH